MESFSGNVGVNVQIQFGRLIWKMPHGESRELKCLAQLNCQLGFVCLFKNDMINNSLSTLTVQLL